MNMDRSYCPSIEPFVIVNFLGYFTWFLMVLITFKLIVFKKRESFNFTVFVFLSYCY